MLAHYLERPVSEEGAGVATVQISLIRPVTEALKPPRALWVPFPFGRPLGPPDRVDIQLDVLRRTLALAHEPVGPVLCDYVEDEVASTDTEEAWVSPVTLPRVTPACESNALARQLKHEAQLLRPWFDEGLRTRGRTAVGTSGKGVDAIEEMLELFARFAIDGDMEVAEGYCHAMPQLLRYLGDDIRDYYMEAAIAKPGATFPTPGDLLEWFYLKTLAGEVFYRVRERLLAADILVLMARGLRDDDIDWQLTLRAGTTATAAPGLLRQPDISRALLRSAAKVFNQAQPNRLSWTVVPVAMRDRRRDWQIEYNRRCSATGPERAEA